MNKQRNRPGTCKNHKKKTNSPRATKTNQETKKQENRVIVCENNKQTDVNPDTAISSKATKNQEAYKSVEKESKKEKCCIKDADENSLNTSECIEKEEICLITEQIHDLRSEYISIQSNFLTVTSIAFVGFGAILYYAFHLESEANLPEPSINYVFIALPFLFGISFLNILKYTVRMLGIGSYISHLEKLLNTRLKKHLFLWHNKLVGINGYTIVGLAQIPCYIALFVVVGKKFMENMNHLKESDIELMGITAADFHFIIMALILFMLIIGVFSIVVASTQHKAVGYWSDFLYKQPCGQKINTHIPYMIHKWKNNKAQEKQNKT